MAMINGIRLRARRKVPGTVYQSRSTIEIDGEKAGHSLFDQSSNLVSIHIIEKKKAMLGERIQDYFMANPPIVESIEVFILELQELSNHEKTFKRCIKDGYTLLAIFRYRKRHWVYDFKYKRTECIAIQDEATLSECIKMKLAVEISVYRSTEDFCIKC
ncbi:hypothetical protein SAMN04487897_109154 [Paenibacillus sp. yr247]|uniref:hypothetical protein n=1 Tax=Paenibacillus sp. yr247 TaxID=1761880 RepID=UPI000890790B|nr:hypothetical protein [Paenibacillus sp. yr247]SDO18948.1 hypothetical protein SAMN04487897_109154 [Paenibacillus sp. yr247]